MQKLLHKMLLLVAMMVVPWVTQGQNFHYTCNFDDDSDTAGWVFVSGTQANQWFIGTAVANSGTKSLYVSQNNGTSNSYNATSISFSYAYQEFSLLAGGYTLAYNWKCNGESNYDYIRVFLMPASATLTAGQSPSGGTSSYDWGSQLLPSGFISLTGTNMKLNEQTSWQEVSTEFSVPTDGTYRLVFAWANDGSVGNDPPGAIDNIYFAQPNCPRTTNLSAHATAGSAYLSWRISPQEMECDGFEVSYRYTADTSATPTTLTTNDLSYVLTGLTEDTSYTVTVTPFCGSDYGDAATTTFSTMSLPCLEWDTTGGSPTLELAVGTDGTNATYYMPVNQDNNYSYFQSIIRTSDISSTGPLSVNSVGFQYAYTQPMTLITNCSIYMAHTTMANLSNQFVPYDSLQLVYVGPLNCTTQGWNYFQFNQGTFLYDGVRNMVIAVVNNSGAHETQSHSFNYHVPGVTLSRRTQGSSPYNASNMTGGSGSTYRVNMRLLTGSGNCIAVASCAAPYVVIDSITPMDVYVSWVPGYQETQWSVEYRQGTTGAWTTAAASTSSTSITLNGLSSNTNYQVRVGAICGDTTYYGTNSFRMPCGYSAVPFTETFESSPTSSSTTGSAFVDCWVRLNNGTSYGGYPYVSSSSDYNHTPGGNRGLYWYNTTTTGSYGDYQCIVLPGIDTTDHPMNTLQVRFWARSSSTSYYPVLYVGVLTDPNDITTFVYLDTIEVGNSTAWQEYESTLRRYTGNGRYAAIRADRGESGMCMLTMSRWRRHRTAPAFAT